VLRRNASGSLRPRLVCSSVYGRFRTEVHRASTKKLELRKEEPATGTSYTREIQRICSDHEAVGEFRQNDHAGREKIPKLSTTPDERPSGRRYLLRPQSTLLRMCALMRVISQSVDALPAVAASSTVLEYDISHRLRSLRKAGMERMTEFVMNAFIREVDSRLYPVKNKRSSLCRRVRMVSDAVLRVRNGRYAS
jgi:hypothetical protein